MYMKRFGLVCSFINASVLNCAGSTELKDFSTSSTPAVWCSSLEYEMWLRFGERCEIAVRITH